MTQTKKRTAFILAAGLGTRLKELTLNKPKALVELNETPLLQVIIENLISQKFNHIVINIHHFGEQIIDFVETNKYKDISIEISDERELLYNTGGAIVKAMSLLKDSEAVLIHNVDILSDINLSSVYDDFVSSTDDAWLLTQNRNNKRKLVFDNNDNYIGRLNLENGDYDGEVDFDDNFKLLSFSGLHIIKPYLFSEFKPKPCYVFELYKELTRKYSIKSKFIETNYWFDLGTQEQLKEAETWLLSQK